MLGKLMKYDLRSGFRKFSLIWIGLAVLAAINGLTIRLVLDGDVESQLVSFFFGVLPMMLLVALFVAMFVFVLIFTVEIFYKGLLGSEGYLMFTLPVTTAEHIASKTLTALIFTVLSTIVAVLSGGILMAVLKPVNYGDIAQAIREISRYLQANPLPAGTGWVIAEFVLYSLFASVAAILQIYAAISIGHLAMKHRGWFALLAYIGISIAAGMITNWCITAIFRSNAFTNVVLAWQFSVENAGWEVQGLGLAASVLGVNIGLTLLLGTAYFFATRAILDKRLNLE